MSTDPTNDVGWTVPDGLEWGGDAHDDRDGDADATARDTATTLEESAPPTPSPSDGAQRDSDTARTPPAHRRDASPRTECHGRGVTATETRAGPTTTTKATGASATPESAAARAEESSLVDSIDLASDDAATPTSPADATTTTDGGTLAAIEDADASTTAPAEPASADDDDADDDERLAEREPSDLPPAPVLATRIDHMRSERHARERKVEAVRTQYEDLLEARNREIQKLRRANESRLASLWRRLRAWF